MTNFDVSSFSDAYCKFIEQKYSSRNSATAYIMHDAICEYIEDEIITKFPNSKVNVRVGNKTSKEYRYKSNLHDKKMDIAIVWGEGKTADMIAAISFKMPLKSVNKNLRNYFEIYVGDTTLTQFDKKPMFYFMILDENSIKVDDGKVKIERISNQSVKPFQKVINHKNDDYFKPKSTLIFKVDFNDSEYKKNFEGKKFTTMKNPKKNLKNHIDGVKKSCAKIAVLDATNWKEDYKDKMNDFFSKIHDVIKLYIDDVINGESDIQTKQA